MENDASQDLFSIPGTTFTCFPKLPTELQLKIWESVNPNLNVVTVKKANELARERCDGRTRVVPTYRAKASYTVPAMLHTCQVSRAIALITYRPSFEKLLGQPLYFDFSKDILTLEDCEALASFLRVPWFADLPIDLEEVNQIRFLAIGGQWISYQDRILQRLHRFEGLKNIYFERQSNDEPGLMNHFEWGLRMKWGTWKMWKLGTYEAFDPEAHMNLPDIRFLEPDKFRALLNILA